MSGHENGTTSRAVTTAGLVVVVLAGLVTASSALFSVRADVPDNVIGAGTIDLTATPSAAVFEVPALAPGGQVHRELVLANTGSLELRHAMVSTTDDPLDGGLGQVVRLAVRTSVTTCDGTGWAQGVPLYDGVLGTRTGTPIYGDQTTGRDTGDRVLEAGASEKLCMRVSLPADAVGTDGDTVTTTFGVVAEQTDNNP